MDTNNTPKTPTHEELLAMLSPRTIAREMCAKFAKDHGGEEAEMQFREGLEDES
jgi:hypothetical protein